MAERGRARHLVVVEAYDGSIEFLTDEPAEREAARLLGLPLEEMAERLGCRVTVLSWDSWFEYEAQDNSFLRWQAPPATRPVAAQISIAPPRGSERIHYRPIPTREPDKGGELTKRPLPSRRVRGLLAESDPFQALSFTLEHRLEELHREDPFDAVLLPMWGGLGYIPQMSRATGCGSLGDVPFVVVATDSSASRQEANAEGFWTRPALTRRQSEDLSLALADLVLVFGPRGERLARRGRLPSASKPVPVPRRVGPALIEAVATEVAVDRSAPPSFFLYEPQQPAAGTLTALDAVALLARGGRRLERPFQCGGPDMVFAPMKPRSFVEYWSSRGFVRELTSAGMWQWGSGWPFAEDVLPIRVYPSRFEHLPYVWGELAQGSMVVLSEAAAEGLAPGESLPRLALIEGEPTPAAVAAAIARIQTTSVEEVDRQRRELCRRVVAAHGRESRESRLDAAVRALGRLIEAPSAPQQLGQVAKLLLDRRVPLAEHARKPKWRLGHVRSSRMNAGAGLTVVIPCFDMGPLLRETMESVWSAERVPDEVLLVDDGSQCPATRELIAELQNEAVRRGRPLQVIHQENRGLAAARNRGLEHARGEFISFLDADDLIAPEFYGQAERLLRQNPELGGVAAWAETFGEGLPLGFWNAPQPELPLLLVENTVFVPVMMRTAMLRRLGGVDVGQRFNYEDWEVSLRLLNAGHPIVTIPRYLQRYRERSDSLLRTMTETQNQAMREYLLANHKPLAERFGVEVSMMLEARLQKLLSARPPLRAPRPVGSPSTEKQTGPHRLGGVRAWLPGARRGREADPSGAHR